MANPRVLILTPAFRPNLGGVEVHLRDLTEYLSAHNYFTYVLAYQPITTNTTGAGLETSLNLEIHRYSWISGNYFNIFVGLHPVFNFLYLTPYLFIRSFWFLIFNRQKVDLIHAIGLSTAISARVFKFIFKKPTVMSTQTLFNFRPGSLFSRISLWVLSGMDKILAQSDESKQELANLGISPDKIIVFSHWIDLEVFKPRPKKSGKFTLLFVGRLIPEKGVRLAIAAAKKLGSKVQLTIIGSAGPELDYVKSSQNNTITYLDGLPYDELPQYYAAANVLVYPALYKEDMAYVLLDSLACGTPVINTNPGSGVYRLPASCAFIIQPTVDEIVKCVQILISNPGRAQKMSVAARRFSQKFGPRLAKIITDVYDSLV